MKEFTRKEKKTEALKFILPKDFSASKTSKFNDEYPIYLDELGFYIRVNGLVCREGVYLVKEDIGIVSVDSKLFESNFIEKEEVKND